MGRKRVLWYGESSLLSSGYSTYAFNLLTYLAKTGKFDILEIAGYSDGTNPRILELPWSHRPVMPRDPKMLEEYNSRPSNQWGEYVFDANCLNFRPEITCSIRDTWMDEYIYLSPARKFFSHIYMPPVDSHPQQNSWMPFFASADKLLTYSQYGFDVLQEQGQGNLNLIKPAYAGVDVNHFKPLNKQACRKSLGIPEDAFIVGTVARNQPRKAYKDLFLSFAKFLETAPPLIAAKSYLYVHSRWPDLSWPFNDLIREFSIGSRVFFSYVCHSCRAINSSLFRGGKAICQACGQHAAEMPGIQNGISPNVLAYVFNSMDCYIQYSSCEGFGMPIVEAAACAVPVMAVDFSAMGDIVRKLGGRAIKVKGLFRDLGVGADRAYPDNDDFVEKLIQFARLPQELRLKHQTAALAGVNKFFTWDIVGKIWEETIDATEGKDWDAPPEIHKIPNFISGLSNVDFVRWGMDSVAGRPDLKRSRFYTDMVRDLNQGHYPDGRPCKQEEVMQSFRVLGEMKNNFERQRCGLA